MALEQKLSLKLSQKLVMTPSLQQAIKLLQMTRMELEGVVTQELQENPLLEEIQEPVEELERERERERELEAEESKLDEDEIDHEEAMENIDLEDYFGDYWESSSYASVSESREAPPIENTLREEDDLYDHLSWQLAMLDLAPRHRHIGELIIGNLDNQGFLVAEPEEIQELATEDLDEAPDLEEVLGMLEVVRGFDPPGIGYRDLRESLLGQLLGQGVDEDELAVQILQDHWDAFLKRQYPAIAKTLGVDLHDLEPVVEQIKALETRPGRKYTTERTHYVEPDVYVRRVGGEYVIQINDDGMPKLRISRAYRRMLAKMKKAGEQADAQQYIKDKMRSALWLIKSIDQRQRTIYKVANSIVAQQRDFLDKGIEFLKPMVLRDVAEDIEMHESTVSRVVSNKYIHTPRGVYPMKYFFHSGIDREYGDNISSLTVKKKIEQLIEEEDAKKPLSDSELMRVLKREGIQIARRTVAKYRDELGIPASTDRRQIF